MRFDDSALCTSADSRSRSITSGAAASRPSSRPLASAMSVNSQTVDPGRGASARRLLRKDIMVVNRAYRRGTERAENTVREAASGEDRVPGFLASLPRNVRDHAFERAARRRIALLRDAP